MTSLDWIIMALPLFVVTGIALYTRRFMRGVADFMAAGRCAGRYLLTTARGEAGSAIAVAVCLWEIAAEAGFSLNWWNLLAGPVGLIITVSGWVIYRYRQTRALTVAQFLEIRYSRAFRRFMGGLAFVAGVINYGVFPGIGGRFFVHFFGLPETVTFTWLGAPHAAPTWLLVAVAYLTVSLTFVLVGGQISLLLTDCVTGMIEQLCYIVIIIALFLLVHWSQIVDVFSAADAMGRHPLLNPMDTNGLATFNLWFVLIQLLNGFYGTMAWQNQHAFNSSALTPHDARMSGVLGAWRGMARTLMVGLLGYCGLVFLKHPDFAAQSAAAVHAVAAIPDATLRGEMQVPVALSHLLPAGIKGVFCAIMLLGLVAGDSAHLHSWGTILAQDVILPWIKRPLSPRAHLRLLRLCIVAVAGIAVAFSATFAMTQPVQLWWMITQTVFVGGAGAAIIGGLYWKKGTTGAAWAAVLTGSSLAAATIVAQTWWKSLVHPWLTGWFPDSAWLAAQAAACPLKSQWMNLGIMIAALTVYAVVSMLTCRQDFDMDRMLHRGRHTATSAPAGPAFRRRHWFLTFLGIDEDFKFWDKFVTLFLFCYSSTFSAVFIAGTLWNLVSPWPLVWWEHYWLVTGIVLPCIFAAVTTVWFTIGGISDVIVFFRRLRVENRDVRDDGTVINHHNLDEAG